MPNFIQFLRLFSEGMIKVTHKGLQGKQPMPCDNMLTYERGHSNTPRL